ncbi:Uncharacterized protein APZ42_025101 [Daphnia magna]|uniref:THAP-type domain-containing protein n=1 Tax=Daphnia magna TaxID=35525 RepID=A0A162DDW7_9CRUS|nr:Uncharacterized protein APZ42_025101 [Daphnia magna]
MSRNKCIVRQCRVTHEKSSDKENGITFFGVPKNFVEKWKDAILYLNKSSHVCSRHFDESNIEKGKEILNVFYPFSRWQLKPGSYPKRMLLDSDYPQELIRKRAGGSDQLAKVCVKKKESVDRLKTNKVGETMLSKKRNDNSIGKKSTSRLVFTSQENIYPSAQLPDGNPVVVPKTFPSLGQVQEQIKFPDKANVLEDTLYLPFQPHTFLHERNLSTCKIHLNADDKARFFREHWDIGKKKEKKLRFPTHPLWLLQLHDSSWDKLQQGNVTVISQTPQSPDSEIGNSWDLELNRYDRHLEEKTAQLSSELIPYSTFLPSDVRIMAEHPLDIHVLNGQMKARSDTLRMSDGAVEGGQNKTKNTSIEHSNRMLGCPADIKKIEQIFTEDWSGAVHTLKLILDLDPPRRHPPLYNWHPPQWKPEVKPKSKSNCQSEFNEKWKSIKYDKDLPTKATDILKDLKHIAQQNKGTMLQFWAKQAIALPTKTVDSTLPVQFLPNSSQFDEINSDCVAVINGKSEKSKETARSGVSKTKAQEIRYHMEAKRLKNEVSQKLKEEQHKLRKLSKMVN